VKERIKKNLQALSVCAITLFTGCNEEIAEAVDTLPKPEYGSRDVLGYREVTSSLKDNDIRIANWVLAGSYSIQYHDQQYISITKDTINRYSGWFANHFNPFIGSSGQASDCDNIAFLYKHILSASTIKNKQSSEILCGVLMVKQINDFGNIWSGPADKSPVLHALNIIKTSDRGWYVVEPQTGTMCPLDSYPNKQYIFRIIF
jgi:hypothetical protein